MARLVCWGAGELGQLGLSPCGSARPQSLTFPGSGSVRAVACGEYHSLFLMEDGSVYSCGDNECQQLGRDGQRVPPARIPVFDTKHIIQLACGEAHSLALTNSGQVYAWGEDGSGQLGLGNASNDNDASIKPRLLPMLSSLRVVQVACGYNHSVALTDTGRLYVWGRNNVGQLGLGDSGRVVNTPHYLSTLQGLPIRQVACGGSHTLIVSVSGAVYAWGRNHKGQLGIGHTQDCWYPTHCKSVRSQRIVHVTAGEAHSAALTMDGGVFTWGCGEQGQLGHCSDSNEHLPRKVFELMGSTVTYLACGKQHTVALVPSSGRVHTFGSNSSGQLGASLGDVPSLSVPTPAALSSVISTEPCFWRVFTGGNQCFLLSRDKEASPDPSKLCTLSDELITRISVLSPHDTPSKELLADINKVFANSSCLNASCLTRDAAHYNCNSHNSGLDLEEALRKFSSISLAANDHVNKKLVGTLSSSLFPSLSPSPPDVEAMRLYLLLPHCRLFDDAANYNDVICPFGASLLSLRDNPAKILDNWWIQLQAEQFMRLVEVYKRTVVFILKLPRPTFRYEVEMRQRHLAASMKVLRKLNTVNGKRRAGVAYDSFYIQELKDCIDVKTDYVNWVQQNRLGQKENALLTFCDYPFVLDAIAKTTVLQTDALIQMQIAVDEVARYNFTSLFSRSIDPVSPLLLLMVTRDNIVADTLDQLTKYASADFKKPLKVVFIGEEAMDAGGVKKEFFLLILKEILDPKYGMFTYYEDSHLIWFSDATFEDSKMYGLIGQLCGLAIYNSTIIALNFPLALYKKILDKPVTLDDLKEMDPSVGRGMEQLLEHEGEDFTDVFPLNFVISRHVYGAVTTTPLVQGGDKIDVTTHNRKEYVDAYIHHVFNESVKEQFSSFHLGFSKVIGGPVLNFFHSQELQAMVVGNENYDFTEFEKNTEYKGDYHRKHPTIRLFWEVFRDLSLHDKKRFLMFLTGTDRVPIVGMSAIKMTIQPCGGGEEYIPASHTCFNLLDLPRYTNKLKLRDKLLTALDNNSGFGLV